MNSSHNEKNTQEASSAKTDSRQQTNTSWMNHPNLSGMDTSKLAMLSALAEQGSKKSPQDLLPFLLSAASQNKAKGVKFSNQEMDAIIQVLKLGKPAAEVERMEKIIQMMKMLH